jgi:hypothetical protein
VEPGDDSTNNVATISLNSGSLEVRKLLPALHNVADRDNDRHEDDDKMQLYQHHNQQQHQNRQHHDPKQEEDTEDDDYWKGDLLTLQATPVRLASQTFIRYSDYVDDTPLSPCSDAEPEVHKTEANFTSAERLQLQPPEQPPNDSSPNSQQSDGEYSPDLFVLTVSNDTGKSMVQSVSRHILFDGAQHAGEDETHTAVDSERIESANDNNTSVAELAGVQTKKTKTTTEMTETSNEKNTTESPTDSLAQKCRLLEEEVCTLIQSHTNMRTHKT